MATSPSYILVTPVKNEEKNIIKLMESVDAQSIKPVLWIIVDDNSTDRSPFLIEKYSEGKEYIRKVTYPEKKEWDIGIHYSEVCIYGFEKAVEIAEKEGIDYEYIALLDADMILDRNYFEILIEAMEEDQTLGIASGDVYSWDGKKYVRNKVKKNLPSGAARIWRRKCFEETGGYILTHSPDAVSDIKAGIRGWKTARISEAKAYQTRLTSTAKGAWVGFMKIGMGVYHIYYPPHVAFLRALSLCVMHGIKEGAAFSLGYFKAWINKYPRIEDEEIKEYNKKRLHEIMEYWLKR